MVSVRHLILRFAIAIVQNKFQQTKKNLKKTISMIITSSRGLFTLQGDLAYCAAVAAARLPGGGGIVMSDE